MMIFRFTILLIKTSGEKILNIEMIYNLNSYFCIIIELVDLSYV